MFGAIIFGIVTMASFVVGYLQFREKGILLNNTYVYAPKTEKETVNKKPYYRQSEIAFTMIGIIFLIDALEWIIETGWLFYLVIGVAVIAIIYAIVSTVVIDRSKK